ncbi:Phosphotransferase enzyme family, putative [Verrucomicrobiia bacterium DG1235]|nr:Phosphotransferase enzyme family, putative [Verrucomicrobiae bacterium DG1235]
MTDRQRIESAIANNTGRPFSIDSQRALGGGCINDAYRIEGSGKTFFVKANSCDFLPAFSTESQALKELAATQTVRVPKVVATIDGDSQAYLILEYIDSRPSRSGNWETIGRQLAALHQIRQAHYGWGQDNLIGATPQPNPQSDNWIDFFREHRLEHQLRLCQTRGFTLPHAEQLLDVLPSFFESHTPYPSLLHGDLWSGNIAFDKAGAPFIFDPACYYGDREADLAFTEFFGGFSPAFYAAYQESLPLDSGYNERKTLYNLYHCLNHLYLFGASYAHQAEQMTKQLLSR